MDLLMLSSLLVVDLMSLVFLHIAALRFVRAKCLKDIAEHYMVIDITEGGSRLETQRGSLTHHLELLPSVIRMRMEVQNVLALYDSPKSQR